MSILFTLGQNIESYVHHMCTHCTVHCARTEYSKQCVHLQMDLDISIKACFFLQTVNLNDNGILVHTFLKTWHIPATDWNYRNPMGEIIWNWKNRLYVYEIHTVLNCCTANLLTWNFITFFDIFHNNNCDMSLDEIKWYIVHAMLHLRMTCVYYVCNTCRENSR